MILAYTGTVRAAASVLAVAAIAAALTVAWMWRRGAMRTHIAALVLAWVILCGSAWIILFRYA